MNTAERKKLMAGVFRNLYGEDPDIWVRAPGRVDLMGSHTDYNLGFVMTMPISRDLLIAASARDPRKGKDPVIDIYSLNLEEQARADLNTLQKTETHPWIDYPAGVASILQSRGYSLKGFNGVVHSTIPIGSGLSSSAAFEAAAITLFQEMSGFAVDPLESAKICQLAENSFVGMNCGILDQYSSILGEKNKTVLLDCKQLTHEAVPFPGEFQAVVCDTNAPRQLTESKYGERRSQCEEGARIIGRRFPEVDSLRDAGLEQLEEVSSEMPEPVYKRSRFVIEENRRVLELGDALRNRSYTGITRLFRESFTGARDLFEISVPAMEQMIDAMNGSPGIIGGRQAGAGFGGCMIALVEKEKTEPFTESVVNRYRQLSGLQADVYPVSTAAGAGKIEGD
jgi:galactokinase